MKVLEGKNAFVTGASKGIGAGIAKGLAEAGASVVVNYASDKAGSDLVVAEIVSKGGKAFAVQADISTVSQAKRLVTETVASLGSLDILANNAGVYLFGPLESVTEEEFHRQFNTNVLGLLVITQEAAKHLDDRDGGSIINIGTAASLTGSPNMVLYLATKSAVDSVTRVLSKELGPKKIRVNSINPGGSTILSGICAIRVLMASPSEATLQQDMTALAQPRRSIPTRTLSQSGTALGS